MNDSAMNWSDPQILTALIAAGVAILLGVVNLFAGQRNLIRLEQMKMTLAQQAKRSDARLEYEYAARLRLYEACGPIMFQLTTAAERARGRILSFAHSNRSGNIGSDPTWLDAERYGYYWASSYYRLLVPAAIAELLKRRLTHLDLSLDTHIHAQYELCLAWADCFSQDFVLARAEPALPYDPHAGTAQDREANPATYWQQGIPRGILESTAAVLIVGEGNEASIMPYGQFEAQLLTKPDSETHLSLRRIAYLLEGFGPAKRPVLWRVICAQFAFAVALIEFRSSQRTLQDAAARVAGIKLDSLDWSPKPDDPTERQAVEHAMRIGVAYAGKRIEAIREKLEGTVAA